MCFLLVRIDLLENENGRALMHPLYKIFDARGLGEYVHIDFSVEDGLTPCLILLSYGNAALDPNNPYLNSKTQVGCVNVDS
jgi:hypothetical protein